MTPGLIRSLGLLLPIILAAGLWQWRKPNPRLAAAFLLACLWNAPALLVLHGLAQHLGWWHFQAQGGLFWGIPVDLYLGWCLLWGGIPLLAFLEMPLVWVALLVFYLDWLVMPLGQPVLQLGNHWWLGEALGLLLGFLPAQWLGRWTARQRCLNGRVWLQVLAFSGWLGIMLPALALEAGRLSGYALSWGSPWTILATHPPWLISLMLQLLALLALPGLSAVQEFAGRGQGTPLPYDPPSVLVTSGLYAYLANPMQCSASLLPLGLGLWWGNGWMLLSTLVFLAYSAGLAAWHEEAELAGRFGEAWTRYRQAVRPWFPRWRPYVPEAATLYVAASCSICHPLGQWLQAGQPVGLVIAPAEQTPGLRRMIYQLPSGYRAEGLAAWARALEHLNLGWALLGCLLRLPLIRPLLQRIVDVSGGGPRDLPPLIS